MNFDKIFTEILNAIEKKNYLEVEAFCQHGLDHIEAGKDIGNHSREEAVLHLTRIKNAARREIIESQKKALIEQIVNQK